MRTRNLFWIVIILVVPIYAVFINGCDISPTGAEKSTLNHFQKSNNTETEIFDKNLNPSYGDFDQIKSTYSGTLANGVSINATYALRYLDTVIVHFTYTIGDVTSEARTLKVFNSFSHLILYNEDQSPIFGYNFILNNDSTATQNIWTNSDDMSITTIRSTSSLKGEITLNGNPYLIEFTDDNELERIQELYMDYLENQSIAAATNEDQILLENYIEFVNFLENNQNSLMDNQEGEIAAYLMNNEGFI